MIPMIYFWLRYANAGFLFYNDVDALKKVNSLGTVSKWVPGPVRLFRSLSIYFRQEWNSDLGLDKARQGF